MRLRVELCSKRAPLGTNEWTVSVCVCVDSLWYGFRTPKLIPKAARLFPHAAPPCLRHLAPLGAATATQQGHKTAQSTWPARADLERQAPRESRQRTRRDRTQAHGAQSAADGERSDRVAKDNRNSKLLTVAPRFAGHFPNPTPYPHPENGACLARATVA